MSQDLRKYMGVPPDLTDISPTRSYIDWEPLNISPELHAMEAKTQASVLTWVSLPLSTNAELGTTN